MGWPTSVAAPDPDPLARGELRLALHEEIDLLPKRYKQPVILCLLEGMTQELAAARLGWTLGSVRGRLARGRARLRDRLIRRGIALAAVIAELVEPGPAAAAAPPFLTIVRTKAAGVVLAVLLAFAGATCAITMLVGEPPQPAARTARVQSVNAPLKAETEQETLASFRGGGPTDQSRATALAPEVAARAVDFRGSVLDPAGRGVAGARLSLVTDAWSVPEPQIVSGDDGSFRFEKTVGDFWRNFAKGGSAVPHVQAVVLATHESFGAAWVNLRVVANDGTSALGGPYPLSLRMVADRAIEGRLIDEQGAAIAGAVVRVDQLYAVPAGNLSPIIDALKRFDLKPYQTSHPRIWPNHLAASMAIPAATTGADGRFTLRGVGRDRQANLSATGPGIARMSWTVLNRNDATAVTKAVRVRWPHRSRPAGLPAARAVIDGDPAVEVYVPAFDLRVDRAPTVRGVVRDAMTGRPVPKALVFIPQVNASVASDDHGEYRLIRPAGVDRLWLVARPPDGAPLVGAARECKALNAFGELTADFALGHAVVVSGRAVERGTGRPMLATRDEGCHGPGPVMGGRVWYRPLVGNRAVAGTEAGDYFLQGTDARGQYVGLVGGNGVFRGLVPPGPGVLLLEAAPGGMPFMWQDLAPIWKESEGYHRRFAYAPLTRREPADDAPPGPGDAKDTMPGAFGPIALEGIVAYRVIDAGVNDHPAEVEISIPTAATCQVRFIDPENRPVRGALVRGVTATPFLQVTLHGDEIEVLALDRTRGRLLTAMTADGRLFAEISLRGDAVNPVIVGMRRAAALTGRLVDDRGIVVAGASWTVTYLSDDLPRVVAPGAPQVTGADGRFRLDGLFSGTR